MIDKVQKIREEVEKRYEYWREKEFNSHSTESEIRMSECQHLLLMLDSSQEEPVSEDLEYASEKYACRFSSSKYGHDKVKDAFIDGANWQKEHLWKPADGDDLPEIDREVVAFQETFPTDVDVPSLLEIVIAHRPNPNGWDGKSVTTGEVEHYTPKTYGKGSWNIPDVKYWLDIELPKEIEL